MSRQERCPTGNENHCHHFGDGGKCCRCGHDSAPSSVAPKNEFDKECVRCGVKVRTAWTTCYRCHKPLCSLSCEEWHLEKDDCWEGSVAEQPQPTVKNARFPESYINVTEQPSREQAVEGLVERLIESMQDAIDGDWAFDVTISEWIRQAEYIRAAICRMEETK